MTESAASIAGFAHPVPTTVGAVVPAAVPILRVEGLAMLGAAVVGYEALGAGWVLFAVLFLVPDLSMLGYLGGPEVGSITYNLGHNVVLPVVLGGLGLVAGSVVIQAVALIWVAHVGFDRMLGYGLKAPSAFGHTHLKTLRPR
jgi:hypothetical protein